MRWGRRAARVALLTSLVLAVLFGAGGWGSGGGGGGGVSAQVPRAPLGVQLQLQGVKESITNWPEFAAANNLTGWGDDPSIPPCLWTGATCDADGRLQSLALQCPVCTVKAEGVVPVSIAASQTLTTLNLQSNLLSGPLPPEYAAPGAFPSLLNLILLDNQLTGSIPEGWADPDAFPRVSLLALGDNRLTGTIPPDFCLPSLLILRINGNNFTGPLPPAWGTNTSLPNLRVVSVHENLLTGTLPPEWGAVGTMEAVEELHLQDNQLSGSLPPEWGGSDEDGMPRLRVLNLSHNPLGGTLPYQWSRQHAFPELKNLALSHTGLEGTLPASWDCQNLDRCGLPQLQTLWLDGNNLSGPVPPSWQQHPGLQVVFVRPGNDLLCALPGAVFGFRLCDARAGVECAQEVQLPACTFIEEDPAGVASGNGDAAGGAASPPAGGSGGGDSGGGDGGSNTGAIVGGVVGGVVAAAAVLVSLLFVRRRRRKGAKAQELPPYAADEAPSQPDKSSHQQSSGFPSSEEPSSPPKPLPPKPPRQLLLRPSEDGEALMLSPFASPFAAVDTNTDALPSPIAERRRESEQDERDVQSMSSEAYFSRLIHGPGGRGSSDGGSTRSGEGEGGGGARFPPSRSTYDLGRTAAAAAAATDRDLDAELERHLSIELAAIEANHGSSAGRAGNPLEASHVLLSNNSTAGTNSTVSSTGAPPGAAFLGAAAGGQLTWEDSVPGLSDWHIQPNEIEIAKRPDGSDWELGAGGFGKVYKALRHGAQPVAVKVLASVGEARYQSNEDFKREIAILRACRDPNIVAFLGASLQTGFTMLVTEYCDGGNLTRNLMAGRVNWYKRGKKIALDVARGLTYLHSRRIIHFDLKSPNILLARDGTAKISDVGMAKIMAREYSGITGNVGTLAWAAPEMLLGARCTEKADVYSYGVVLWEISTGQTPIRGQLRDLRVPEECPPEVRELILDCLATNPRKRPSAVELVERLRALPDSPAPPGSQTPARLPAPASPQRFGGWAPSPGRQPSARIPSGSVISTPAAASPQVPSSQRPSEEEAPSVSPVRSSIDVVEAAAAQQALSSAYASPAPGSTALTAAARLAEAMGNGGGGGMRRSGSAVLSTLKLSLPQPQEQEGQQEQEGHEGQQEQEGQQLERANSSPPGAGFVHRPPVPGQRGLTLQRQHSLDDPTQQMAELRTTIRQLTGHAQPAASRQQPPVSPGFAAASEARPKASQLAGLQHSLHRLSEQLPDSVGELSGRPSLTTAGTAELPGQAGSYQGQHLGGFSPQRSPFDQSEQAGGQQFGGQAEGQHHVAAATHHDHRPSSNTSSYEQLTNQHFEEHSQMEAQQGRQQHVLARQQWAAQLELSHRQQGEQQRMTAQHAGECRRMERRQEGEIEQERVEQQGSLGRASHSVSGGSVQQGPENNSN